MAIFVGIMTTLLPIAYALFFVYLIAKMPVFGRLKIKRSIVAGIFVLKITFGVLFLWLYNGQFEDRSKADVYKFFDDSAVLHAAAGDNFGDYVSLMLGYGDDQDLHVYHDEMQNWIRQYDHGFSNDNRFMIRYNALLRWVSMGNVWCHMVITNFILFWALILLVLALSKEHNFGWILFLGFLMPSMLFWSSGVLKETLALIGICWFIHALSNIKSKPFQSMVIGLLALLILLNLKVYLLLFLVLSLAVYKLFESKSSLKFNGQKYALFLAVGALIILGIGQTNFGKSKMEAIAFKQKDFKNIANGGVICKNDTAYVFVPDEQREICIIRDDQVQFVPGASFSYLRLPNTKDTLQIDDYHSSATFDLVFENKKSGSQVYVPALDNHLGSFVKASPNALYNVLFRPLPFEFSSALLTFTSLEVLLIWIMVFAALVYSKPKDHIQWNKVFASLFFVLAVYYLIGVSTPVLGAIVRYKVPVLPFVLYVCCLIADWEKIGQKKPVLWLKSFVLQAQHQA